MKSNNIINNDYINIVIIKVERKYKIGVYENDV